MPPVGVQRAPPALASYRRSRHAGPAVPPAGALRALGWGGPLAWLRPAPPSSGPSAEQTSRAASSGGRACRLARPARPAGAAGGTTATGWARPTGVCSGRACPDFTCGPGYFAVGTGAWAPQRPRQPLASPQPRLIRRTGAPAGIIPANAPATRFTTPGVPPAPRADASTVLSVPVLCSRSLCWLCAVQSLFAVTTQPG